MLRFWRKMAYCIFRSIAENRLLCAKMAGTARGLVRGFLDCATDVL